MDQISPKLNLQAPRAQISSGSSSLCIPVDIGSIADQIARKGSIDRVLVHTVRFVLVVQAVAWQIHVFSDAYDRFLSARDDQKRVPRDRNDVDA